VYCVVLCSIANFVTNVAAPRLVGDEVVHDGRNYGVNGMEVLCHVCVVVVGY
jgi:hypothetical protein